MTKRVTGQITRAEAKKQKAGVFVCCNNIHPSEIFKGTVDDKMLLVNFGNTTSPLCDECKLFGNYWHAYAYIRKKNDRRTNV